MLIIALVAVIGSGVWGFGVFGQLTEGGYNDPRSESARAAEVVAAATGGQDGDVIAIYTPDKGTINDAALTKRITERLKALPESAVTSHVSYWEGKKAAFAAADKSSAVAVITLTGDDDADKMTAYGEIEDSFAVDGARVQIAGAIPLSYASNQRSTDDLAFAEMISLPIVLILLLIIFGSLVAASLPVLIGGCAVLGSLGVLHAVALTSEVNSFAVNVASLLGLGMAIDYGLFMVGRFREEQAVTGTAEAVRRTVATAGRTVVFSATLLMTALAGLLLFPQGFLKSLAYGGLAAVFLAMLLSLTLLPALLAVLGPRVDLVPVRLPRFGSGGNGGWERLAGWVLRRPVLVAVPILAVLLGLALPIMDARFGENDERQLPAGDPSRVAVETLKADYPQFGSDGVQVVVRATDGKKPDVKAFTAAVGKVAGIAGVAPTGGNGKDVVVLTAALSSTDVFSTEARDAVDGLRAMAAPARTEVIVGGITARNIDSLEAIGAKLPVMIGLLVGATLVLMFLAFGSILLPVKAVVMSALSLSATFGTLVWIFQEGHGAELLNVTPTPLEAGIVVLMAAVVFGLSTDYEVFLLSRMVEARLHGASTVEAVTIGLTRTGRVISAAALLLIVVTGAFSLSSVTTMRFIGVGMIIALVLDATVVRVLLVPAVMRLLGDACWWAPGPLRRLQEKAGLAEYAGEEEAHGRHAWRPVDPSFEETTVLDGTLLDRVSSPAAALPAGTSAALPAGTSGALPAGTSGDTVVLDYNAVLGHLADKESAAAHAVGLLSGRSAADDAPIDSPATDSASGDPGSDSEAAAAATPADEDTTTESPDDAGLTETEVIWAEVEASMNAPEPVDPETIWAEVEATLAAGAESVRDHSETTPDEINTDDEDPAATQVIRLPADATDASVTRVLQLPPTGDSPADAATTQVIHLPAATATVEDAAGAPDETRSPASATTPIDEPADQPPLPAGDHPETGADSGPGADDLFAWRSDPRLANLTAPGSDDFNWLDRTTGRGNPVQPTESTPAAPLPSPPQPSTPQPSSPQPSSPQPSSPQPSSPQPSSPQLSSPLPSSPQPSTPLPSSPLPSSPLPSSPQPSSPQPSSPQPSTPLPSSPLPDAVLPYPGSGRPGAHRPQTLGDWLAGGPATPRRPQTLDEWLNTTAAPPTATPDPEPSDPVPADPGVTPSAQQDTPPAATPDDEATEAPSPESPEPADATSPALDDDAPSAATPAAPAAGEARSEPADQTPTTGGPTAAPLEAAEVIPPAPAAESTTEAAAPAADAQEPAAGEPAFDEKPADHSEPDESNDADRLDPAPVSSGAPARRPESLGDLAGVPVSPGAAVRRPTTLEDLSGSAVRRTQTLGEWPGGNAPAAVVSDPPAAEQERQEVEFEFQRGRRPETLDDRLRGTIRPATLADHLPEHGPGARRPANTGPSWTVASGEHPYDRQSRRPATLADHPGPARTDPDDEPEADGTTRP